MKRVLPFLLTVVLISPLHAEPKAASPSEAQKLVNTYCVSCHGGKTAKGNLSLERFAKKPWNDYDLFNEIVSRIEDGEMPPMGAKNRLPAADKAKLLALLKTRLGALDSAQLAGRFKKITAREYSNTLVDLFGHPIEKLSDLPYDSDHEVKKIGEHQVVTSYAVKKYYEAAEEYLDRYLIDVPVSPKETTYTAANGKDFVGRRYVTRAGALAGGGNMPQFMVRNPVRSYAEEGEYEITFDWYCFYGPPNEPTQQERVKPLRPPTILVPSRNGKVLNPFQTYKSDFQVLCRMDKPIRMVLTKNVKLLSFRGPDKGFKSIDKSDPRYVKLLHSDLPKNQKRAALKTLTNKMMEEIHGKKNMMILVKGATLRGPLNKPEAPLNTRLFGKVKRTDPFESCLPIIKDLAHKLFRRPVSDAVLQDYYEIARAEHKESKNTYQAVKATLNTMLCSPHFLFKNEGNQENLDDFMIASRLSYFLWNGTPDDELYRLAAAGKLKDPAVRRQQALRLLANREKSARFTENFTYQWLGLHKFGAYTPNEAYIETKRFTPLKPHLEREPQAFFDEVLHNNLNALNFIHSDFVVWNGHLRSYYSGATPQLKVSKAPKDVDRDTFYRSSLTQNPGMVRGGLMTMVSIMSLTTDGENTQPILRGVWIARRLLGMEIEPPATVPALEINLENVSRPREILAKHKTDPNCYACHVKFDHFGLALENFDVIGQWKTSYVHPVQDEKGKFKLVTKGPIDSAAETPDGKPIPGVKGLKAYLMANKGQVMQNLVERLFAYSLGRNVLYRDRKQIRSLLENMKANDYKLKDLILDMIASKSFAKR